MQVRGHNHVGVDAEFFLTMTEAQALGHDLTTRLRHEHRQPFHYRVGQVIEGGVRVDSVAFHDGIVRREPAACQARRHSPAEGEYGDLRSGRWHGQETVPQRDGNFYGTTLFGGASSAVLSAENATARTLSLREPRPIISEPY